MWGRGSARPPRRPGPSPKGSAVATRGWGVAGARTDGGHYCRDAWACAWRELRSGRLLLRAGRITGHAWPPSHADGSAEPYLGRRTTLPSGARDSSPGMRGIGGRQARRRTAARLNRRVRPLSPAPSARRGRAAKVIPARRSRASFVAEAVALRHTGEALACRPKRASAKGHLRRPLGAPSRSATDAAAVGAGHLVSCSTPAAACRAFRARTGVA